MRKANLYSISFIDTSNSPGPDISTQCHPSLNKLELHMPILTLLSINNMLQKGYEVFSFNIIFIQLTILSIILYLFFLAYFVPLLGKGLHLPFPHYSVSCMPVFLVRVDPDVQSLHDVVWHFMGPPFLV